MSKVIDVLDEHTRKHAEMFAEDSTSYIESLIVSQEKRFLVKWFYNRLVAAKKITDVKDLSDEDKRELWETTKTMAAGRLNEKQMATFAICIYTMTLLADDKL